MPSQSAGISPVTSIYTDTRIGAALHMHIHPYNKHKMEITHAYTPRRLNA